MSRTRDLRSPAVVGRTGPVVGEARTLATRALASAAAAVPCTPLTGEGLADNLDSSLLGKEIGRGMRDLEAEDKGRRSLTFDPPELLLI